MQCRIAITGPEVRLASDAEITVAVRAAWTVLEKRSADPAAAFAAREKCDRDELLTREEALLCVIWDEAEYAAWHAMTHGWLIRDIDIRLVVHSVAPSA